MSKRKNNDASIPVVEKLYKEQQKSYDEAGGFDTKDDEFEERRERISEARQFRRNQPFLNVPTPEYCQECEGPLGESELWQRYGYPTCRDCRDGEVKHKLLPRTEAKSRFLLKDYDLDSRKPPLRYIAKKNPHNPRYGDMKLYLLPQLEERAIEVHGSMEKLEEAKELAISKREAMNERKFEKKIKTMRTELRNAANPKNLKLKTHEHEFGPEKYNAKDSSYSRKCKTCDFVQSFEKM